MAIALLSLITGFLPILLVIEFILSGTWNRIYFRYGMPIFRRRYVVGTALQKPTSSAIESLLLHKLPYRMLLKEFRSTEYGFRYTFLHLGQGAASVMHGMLDFDETARVVSVTGYANWTLISIALIVPLFVLALASAETVLVALGIGLFCAWLYRSDASAFSNVGEVTRDAWQGAETKVVGK